MKTDKKLRDVEEETTAAIWGWGGLDGHSGGRGWCVSGLPTGGGHVGLGEVSARVRT